MRLKNYAGCSPLQCHRQSSSADWTTDPFPETRQSACPGHQKSPHQDRGCSSFRLQSTVAPLDFPAFVSVIGPYPLLHANISYCFTSLVVCIREHFTHAHSRTVQWTRIHCFSIRLSRTMFAYNVCVPVSRGCARD